MHKMNSRLIVMLLLAGAIDCTTFSHILGSYETTDGESARNIYLFVSFIVLTSAILRQLIRTYHIPIPLSTFVLALGIIWGIIAIYFKPLLSYTSLIINHLTDMIMYFYLPIILFEVAFCIDVHTFFKSFPQIFIISIPVALTNACFIGFVMKFSMNISWNFADAFLFGMLCSPIYTSIVVQMLKKMGGHTKHVVSLLEGESMIGIATTILVYDVVKHYYDGVFTEWHHYVVDILRMSSIGIVMGLVVGFAGRLIMRVMYQDPVNLVTIIISIAMTTFYITDTYLKSSSCLCIVIAGIMMSIERMSATEEMNDLMVHIWNTMSRTMHCIIFMISGVTISLHVAHQDTNVREYMMILVTYLLANMGRFLSFLIYSPILKRIGYGMSFRHLLVLVFAGLKSPICIVLVLLFHEGFQEHAKEIPMTFFILISGMFFLSSLINGGALTWVIRLLRQTQFSVNQSNMNICVKYALIKRVQTIAILKMDRFLSDANWPLINKATTIQMYSGGKDYQEEGVVIMGTKVVMSGEHQPDESDEPTAEQSHELMREARIRVLKAKRISYYKQFGQCMLSDEAIRNLIQSVEVAMDADTGLIELTGLENLFKKETKVDTIIRRCFHFLFKSGRATILPPKKRRRRTVYDFIRHKSFLIFIYSVTAISVIAISFELAYKPRPSSVLSYAFSVITSTLYLIYQIECVLKLYGYSYVSFVKDGIFTYFKSIWNVVDFVVLLATLTDMIMDYIELITKTFDKRSSVGISLLIVRMMHALHIFKLVRYDRIFYPKLMQYIELRSDRHVSLAYEIGKSHVVAEEEVLEILPHMIENQKIKNAVKKRMEQDKLVVMKLLCVVQKERPWIAVTVKTRQAMMTVVNSMKEAINDLKVSGLIDDAENFKLTQSLNERYKYVRSIQTIPSSYPKDIFKEVSWMAGEEEVIDYLFSNLTTKQYDPGDIVCEEGENADGICILITGFLLLSYNPRFKTLQHLYSSGCLPVVDFLSPMKYTERLYDYILPGNCVGELSILTERPHNCTVKADTYSYAHVLKRDVLKAAMAISPDPIKGLECRIWKWSSIGIAKDILKKVPVYQSATLENLKYALERSIMPLLTQYQTFLVNASIEDVVLIEGMVEDLNTRDIYIAPSYIPRTVQRLIIKRPQWFVSTKLFIIPVKDVELFLMEKDKETCELVDTASSRCLLHLVNNRPKMRKRRRKTKVAKRAELIVGANTSLNYINSRLSKDLSTVVNIDDLQLQTSHNDFALTNSNPNETKPSKEK